MVHSLIHHQPPHSAKIPIYSLISIVDGTKDKKHHIDSTAQYLLLDYMLSPLSQSQDCMTSTNEDLVFNETVVLCWWGSET